MKLKLYSIIAVILISFSGCSKDDDNGILIPNINFVHEDGSKILTDECINPNDNYAISITIEQENRGAFKPTKIDYTLNGSLNSLTFTDLGTKIIPISLSEGENTAQLVKSGIYSKLYYVIQDDFELVE